MKIDFPYIYLVLCYSKFNSTFLHIAEIQEAVIEHGDFKFNVDEK